MARPWCLLWALAWSTGLATHATGPVEAPQSAPVIAAASDLQFALKEVAVVFEAGGGGRVEVVFGSSGTLSRQIQDGAPFEMFLSADESFVAALAAAGLTRDAGDLYAIGRLALFAPTGSRLVLDPALGGVRSLLDQDGSWRLAIANPAHAPYGRAAEAALRTHGLWDRLQPHLVLGENASQAAQFATTGNAVGGIIAHSLAVAPPMAARGRFVLLAAEDHPPLRQRMVRLKRAGAVTDRFYAYLRQPAARAILARHGFATDADADP
jgi:molybdate transport system substrate-binding protein